VGASEAPAIEQESGEGVGFHALGLAAQGQFHAVIPDRIGYDDIHRIEGEDDVPCGTQEGIVRRVQAHEADAAVDFHAAEGLGVAIQVGLGQLGSVQGLYEVRVGVAVEAIEHLDVQL
jgi:hypothetical protein